MILCPNMPPEARFPRAMSSGAAKQPAAWRAWDQAQREEWMTSWSDDVFYFPQPFLTITFTLSAKSWQHCCAVPLLLPVLQRGCTMKGHLSREKAFFWSLLISQHRLCLISSQAVVSCLFLPLAFPYCDAVLETWGRCTVEQHCDLHTCIFLPFGVMCSLLDTDTSFRPLFLSLLPSLLLLKWPHDPRPPQACCSP